MDIGMFINLFKLHQVFDFSSLLNVEVTQTVVHNILFPFNGHDQN